MKQELYNCRRIDARHYKMTKFDEDLNPVYSAQKNASPRLCSYVCSTDTCDCPAGEAKSCRHRKMLNIFISNKKVDSEYFFNYERHDWYRAPGIEFEVVPITKPLLEGITIVGLDDPALLHNTIAEALGEPPTTEQNFQGSRFDPEFMDKLKEGVQKTASEVPSPQPSTKTYRRF